MSNFSGAYLIVALTLVGRGEHWDFRFCGFGHFLDRFLGLCAKRLRFFDFGVRCGLRIFRFLSTRFSVSVEIIAVFRFYYPMWILGFPILSCLGSCFSSI